MRKEGSSPRIRGKSALHPEQAVACGIIPANTGKIGYELAHHHLPRDHPREYGENVDTHKCIVCDRGSSPRIRGKSSCTRPIDHTAGIIPANTGKIIASTVSGHPSWDHPREYGENVLRQLLLTGQRGSSPRIRGKLKPTFLNAAPLGIIPANTGKIVRVCPPPHGAGDHPREYGENLG